MRLTVPLCETPGPGTLAPSRRECSVLGPRTARRPMTAGPLSATLVRRAPARPQTRETLLLARAQRGDAAAFEELAGERVDRPFALTNHQAAYCERGAR